jgi:hypothetical protein
MRAKGPVVYKVAGSPAQSVAKRVEVVCIIAPPTGNTTLSDYNGFVSRAGNVPIDGRAVWCQDEVVKMADPDSCWDR